MSPESRATMELIRQELANPETGEDRARELCRQAVDLVRHDRGIKAAVTEEKRPAKRAAKVDGNAILNGFLGDTKA